jgi:hypothetical protein
MKSIPSGAQVDRALKAASREVKNALKRMNQQAGKLLARGAYEEAQSLVEAGRSIAGFQSEVDELRRNWKSLRIAARSERGRRGATAVAAFRLPILRLMAGKGGAVPWKQVELELRADAVGLALQPGDLDTVRGRPLWVRAASRARSALVREGLIHYSGGSRMSMQ